MGFLVAALLLVLAVPVGATAQDAQLEDFFPLITRRPVVESEVELRVNHQKDRRDRLTSPVLAVDYVVLPRWQVELSVPMIFSDPHDRRATQALGDVGFENKVVLWRQKSQAVVSAGIELTLPSGSDHRLGSELVVGPFLSSGLAVRSFYLVGHVEYDWSLRGPNRREEEVDASVAAGYRIKQFIPLLELSSVTQTREQFTKGDRRLLERLQLYATPGVNWEITRNLTLGLGVQVPVTRARTLDYTIIGSLDWAFSP